MDLARKPLALDRVWKRLRCFFDDGPLWPRRIAARGLLKAREKRILCWWLRRVEEIARRLLLIEALGLEAPHLAHRARTQAARPSALIYCCEHALEPSEWRVRFRVRPQTALQIRPGKSATRRRKPPALYLGWLRTARFAENPADCSRWFTPIAPQR